MNYGHIEDAMNTITDMEVIRNNTKQDDGVDKLVGVDWFKFNNKVCDFIYASGNSYIGFGSNTSHLKVCNRDGAMYYLYRQEATLYGFYKFLKIRWEGYTRYNYTSIEYKTVYELFMFDTGDMFLNLINVPTSTSYIGTSTILSNNSNISLGIKAATPDVISFYQMDENGVSWDVKHEILNIEIPYDSRYLVRSEGKYYTLMNGALSEIVVDVINAETFQNHGFVKPESFDFMINMGNPDLLNWVDTDLPLDDIALRYQAVPADQIISTESYDLTDPSIAGIESIVVDADAGFQFSFDKGVTYKVYQEAWITADDVWMTKAAVIAIPVSAFDLNTLTEYMVRIKLSDSGYFKNMIIKYTNGA
ncbi:hypothetical protein MKC54_05285 [[Clostridium] innocuum]|nr:hypothetical protein [[Clostridium] innocuum]MCR0576294.1 hypothetical protein [[Clostridium] innocuum]